MNIELEIVSGVAVVPTAAQLRQWSREQRRQGRRVALVPTMGALHCGHISLVQLAQQHADAVAVSIFVNPLQFGPNEDLAKYPRQFESDCAQCAAADVAVVFAPTVAEMYPAGFQTRVELPQLAARWDGASRPGHFAGVATVVLKLLNAAEADVAVFGEKDWQQLQIIRQLVADVGHSTEIIAAPIARDPDGLALSSRNAYLSADERQRALAIHRGLTDLQRAAAAGRTDTAQLMDEFRATVERAGGRVDYAAIVDPATLEPLATLDRPARAIAAAWFGTPKLLDNCQVSPPAG